MISEDKSMILNTLNIKKGSLICLFFVSIFAGCKAPNKPSQEYKIAGNALGTTYHITYVGDEIPNLKSAIDSMIAEFNYGVSTYDPNSFITCYNEGKPLSILDLKPGYQYLGDVISLSKPIVEATHGAFDPSAAALFDLYSKAKKEGRLMDSIGVQQALNTRGLEHIVFGSDSMMVHPIGKKINFNAIAKGYFVDLLADLLTHNGSEQHMVEVGGEVNCTGNNGKGMPWNIGINRPVVGADPSDFFEVISLYNQSMATSGNYQNFYIVNDSVVGHTLDPRTGKPVMSDLKSATIIHKECAVADAYATACMVLGLQASKELIQNDSTLTAFFIYEENGTLKGLHVK